LLGVAGGCVFAIMKVRGILQKMDTTVSPKLDEVGKTLTAVKPAVAQTGPLMESVNVAMDAVDMKIVEIDGTLAKIAGIGNQVIGIAATVPEVANKTNQSIKDKLFKRG
jgi:uncharacterized protein YoxC